MSALRTMIDDVGEWRCAPLHETDEKDSPRKRSHGLDILRACANSRTTWRVATVLCIFLLVANLIQPTRKVVQGFTVDYDGKVDWSQYAYCQYVTTEAYLCNSLMIFESLTRAGVKAQKLMMYPEHWNVGESDAGRLLDKAQALYGVRLQPIEIQHLSKDATWGDSFTKLLAFNQTEFKRVLSLDSDATVLQSMDELFLLPSAPVAMPRAYWLDDHSLSSQLVLIEPSKVEFERILTAFDNVTANEFDMEIVNDLYAEYCFIIPHRRYDLLTGEFKAEDHTRYLGSPNEVWDPESVMNEAKYLHFSDWPFPKPWVHYSAQQLAAATPKCLQRENNTEEDCRNRDVWLWAYEDFLARREAVCES